MELAILFTGKSPKYIEIYQSIKQAILTKKLLAHEQLPSKRTLAQTLNVSVHTIKEAYEQLLAEGYIYSKERAGYFIAPFEVDWLQHKQQLPSTPMPSTPNDIQFDFNNGHVDNKAFPYTVWYKLIKKHFTVDNLTISPWQGEDALRTEIARYVERSRGVTCDASQVFVSSGTQSQLQFLCHFFGSKTCVGLEEPGFKRVRAVLQQCGLATQAIPVDHAGITIPSKDIHLLYTTPAHQFPLGMIMTMERRAALLHWASLNQAYIIEDDYDAEFRYKGLPIPSLAKLDQLQHVIYFGTFSKTLLPSLRISYMVLPTSLVASFTAFYLEQKSVVSKVDQLVLADFMAQGLFDKHLAKMRTIYRKKQQALLTAISVHFSAEFQVIGEKSGLHIVIKLPNRLSEARAIQLAEEIGIHVYPCATSYQHKTSEAMVIIGYGGLTLQQINDGIARLAAVWQ
ncbi:PLP-dependent aminotransferase family protein [Lysinibacillus macroides]|uniref:GntR family transcriptional regulator n=1 Tax=Lysinibacillus macroides TaxID=33935 RepID=A0A0N0CXD0_9BACI|nr:PLP-dependent aminotransferase family protein [Lysinibacillus macroides]KOY84164.1 GntR family transcriptional regulator [Lysinibacillus macroides]QPR66939.1 PLP-dependent aminotransferase family protein [Lysinibacillus macroides]